MNAPKLYQSIMVSSTFTDLKAHRQKAIDAIEKLGFKAEAMESSGANAHSDVIETSLQMVRDAAAYIGVISRKYGQTPECDIRNKSCLSITELEFAEAERLDRPRLLFIMDEKHPVTESDVELDPVKREKLEAFRKRAKLMQPDSKVQRIYETFDSPEDFARKAGIAIGNLAKLLEQPNPPPPTPSQPTDAPLPTPPALRAMPRYRGSHPFVGRAAQLETLDEWASPANQNPLLLFEAMGGSGKSLLTWHWTTQRAEKARDDWAGRFWYSFYEKGAVMADFCRQALAYMTDKSTSDYEQQSQSQLNEQLLAHLNAKPWLLVLDGLERVLVAYHRSDAPLMRDEDVDSATDPIGNREPRRAIRHEDDELLAALAGAQPSRILVTTRLTPLALLSPSGNTIHGVRREQLSGLRPEDAEAMMRAHGIRGDSSAMRAYLQRNCDCHPLVTGVIAGLIKKHTIAPGNFDKWVNAPEGGGALNLGELNLMQRQNHILAHAIVGVEGDERHVLNLLSLFPRAVDYDVLVELVSTNDALDERRLINALSRLREWGLVQCDGDAGGYDLHPVVRGVVAGLMDAQTADSVGETLVYHITALPHNSWAEARTIEDVQSGIDLVATLLRLQRFEEAFFTYSGDLALALLYNLEALAEIQQLLRPFFPNGWDGALVPLTDWQETYLLHAAASALAADDRDKAIMLYERALRIDIKNENIPEVSVGIYNLASLQQQAVAKLRFYQLIADIAEQCDDPAKIFRSRCDFYIFHVNYGDPREAERLWLEIDAMRRNWPRNLYRPGELEYSRALDLFYRNLLVEAMLVEVETLADQGHNRGVQNYIRWLRGLWQLDRQSYAAAVQSFDSAIQMTRERGREDRASEAWRALARLRSGAVDEARATAERLSDSGQDNALAELWHELGDHDRALVHARRAHEWAAQDGEPYVHRYWLNRIRALYAKMGVDPPDVPTYDPAAHPPFAWEADVRALIEKKKAERAAEAKGTG